MALQKPKVAITRIRCLRSHDASNARANAADHEANGEHALIWLAVLRVPLVVV